MQRKELGDSQRIDLLEQLYESVAEPGVKWAPFLDALATVLDARAACLHQQSKRTHGCTISAWYGIETSTLGIYHEYYGSVNPWSAKVLASVTPGQAFLGLRLLDKKRYVNSEFYTDFFKPLDLHDSMGGCVFSETDGATNLTALRAKGQGPFDDREVRIVEFLIPHLQRAMRLHKAMTDLRAVSTAAGSALDQVPFGVVLIGRNSEILVTNRAADATLTAGDGLKLTRSGLQAESHADHLKLERALDEARSTTRSVCSKESGLISIRRSSGKRDLRLFVTPLGPCGNLLGESQAATAIFVMDPDTRPEVEPAVLQEQYGLTPAEAGVACLVIAGSAVSEVCRSLGVTANTVRTHLKRIYLKTSTHSQGDLIRLILCGPSGIRVDQPVVIDSS